MAASRQWRHEYRGAGARAPVVTTTAPPLPPRPRRLRAPLSLIRRLLGPTLLLVLFSNLLILLLVIVHIDAEWLRQADIKRGMLVGLALTAAMSALVALFIARRVAGPIVQMHRVLRRRGLETRPDELPLYCGGEAQDLALAFSDLLVQLRAQREQLLAEIAARDTAQAQLEGRNRDLAQANQEIEQFVYLASHDLQEPLRTVRSCIEVLREAHAPALDAEGREVLDFVAASSERMQALILGLLEHSRLGRMSAPVDVNLQAILDEVCADLSARITQQQGEVTVGPLPPVRGRPLELRQLFQNLIANALKFHRPDAPPRVEVGHQGEGARAAYFVRDEGIGIPSEAQAQSFQMFSRLHPAGDYEGSGLGLANAKKIVELHGGRIWMDSTPGVGTTIWFTLRDTDALSEHDSAR